MLTSDRLIPALSLSCVGLTLLYMTLVVMTVFFAAWQTQSTSSVRSTQSAIGNLESNYYSTVNHLTSLDPSSFGYVAPAQVQYVAETRDTSAALSFAK